MASTNFLPFDPNKENVMGDTEYNSSQQRLNGVQGGIASSKLHNKSMIQTSLVAAAIAQYMVSAGYDALDTDTVAGFADKLKQSILANQTGLAKATTQMVEAGTDDTAYITSYLLKHFYDYWRATRDQGALQSDNTHYVTPQVMHANKQWREIARLTTSGTYTVPDGVYKLGVFLLGGGQSGQGYGLEIDTSDSYANGSAKGGASGWGKSVILNVTPGQQIKAVIGSGGVCTNGARAAGGDTLFGSYSAMGGGKTRSKAEGVQDVLYFDYDAAVFVKDVNSPFGGVSGLAGITFDDYDYGVVSWISTAVEEEKNIFLPTMKAFGLGECIALQYRDDSTIGNQYKTSAVDLGTMGKAGVAKVYTFTGDGEGSTYKGGDASGYGNGGGACMSCTRNRLNKSTTLGGNGSPGIIIIYV